MAGLIDIKDACVSLVLPILLQDKTTGKSIIWATDSYEVYGDWYKAERNMAVGTVTALSGGELAPRITKTTDSQKERTRKHAEVFTPSWICNKMNNYVDEGWFGRKDVFNAEGDGRWETVREPIEFPKRKRWQRYVDSRRLEITCGEAPFLVSRYDAATGERIPIKDRIGLLDRKLRVVSENTDTEKEWFEWTKRAFESIYGYEFQGDNLLIARINLLMTFVENVSERFGRLPTRSELTKIARVIAWNIWQMDGLKGTVPFGSLWQQYVQISFWDLLPDQPSAETPEHPKCRFMDWRGGASLDFTNRMTRKGKEMKFDFVIGNPPYQEETESESTRMLPIYDIFMDAAYKVGDYVELITPARFLFNAGQTPKAWNQKMLEDPHMSVLYYEQDGARVFSNTDIKGGIAITSRNAKKETEPIIAYVPYPELRGILKKAGAHTINDSLTDIADSSPVYDLTNIYSDHPDYRCYIADGGRHAQLKTNVLNINPIFTDVSESDDEYKVYGLVNGKRGCKYCRKRYIKPTHKSLSKFKVLVPKAAGSGKFDDSFPPIFVAKPNEAFTQTYISIGMFESETEAICLEKYVKTKMCRALLYVLKVTQDNLPAAWRCIPKQDFTPASDIDWSKPIPDIDRQLYRKYALSEEEIAFIENHVKEMV